MANIVAIVGRPNVGKSTFFNRLVEKKQAIMDDTAGVTRDRHYGQAEWNGRHFTVIDTGGYVTGSDDVFERAIRGQVETAIRESTVVFLMVDCKDGLTDLDKEFSKVIRLTGKPVYLIANKADNITLTMAANEFYALGFEKLYMISSATGSGTGDLLDDLVDNHIRDDIEDDTGGLPRIAIIGRPNVGKSSLLNALVGEERAIVTDIAGTTRDSLNTRYTLFGKDFLLIDTAGVRKKTKVRDNVEFYSVMRSIRVLEDSDVCMILLDATQGLESQDMNLIALALKYKKGVVVLVNKWDLVDKDGKTADKLKKEMNEKLGQLDFIPIMFISVLNKQRIFQAVEKALEVYENLHRRVPTSDLNAALLQSIDKYPPPAIKGKFIKIKYITQLPTKSPTIAFFCSNPKYIQPSYERYLENQVREHFNFSGVPVKLVFREK